MITNKSKLEKEKFEKKNLEKIELNFKLNY